ncbi:sigma factor-like helix-turn-helix DNA-binding protein, partial [Acinetobacter indicus]|uniref:sigma factor-like helix-turn-helix DNA-binding protein n=1 Tax=Acinetobacter indicus TaxID=756892 RepID=UPI000AC09D78
LEAYYVHQNYLVYQLSLPPAASLNQACPADEVQGSLADLPLRQQQSFMLRAWAGFVTQTPAQIMNCSDGSVKTHYHRAIQALRQTLAHMNPYLGGSSD